MNQFITAIIPVKGQSARLPNKNILPFSDSNLLIHKIRQLKQVNCLESIIVSSDSDEMLEMAKAEGVTPLKRPVEFADESRPFGEFIEYLCNNVHGDHFMYACATSPLVEPMLYEKAVGLYFDNLGEYDSLITVLRLQTYLLDDKGPLNFQPGLKHINSEKLKPLYHFTNGINIAPKNSMRAWHYNYGPNAYRLEVNKRDAVDIDDVYDYEIAKALFSFKLN